MLPDHSRNIPAITMEDQERLATFRIAIVGLGGLGGYLLEYLCRLGFYHFTLIDGDMIQKSNLNRQLLTTHDHIGKSKIQLAKERALAIAPHLHLTLHQHYLTADNGPEILANHDLVFDGVDTITSRFDLESTCCNLGIPLVHGAIQGWSGQVAFITPQQPLMAKIYKKRENPQVPSSLSFTPSIIASYQVAQGVKYLLNKGQVLHNQLLYIDLFNTTTHIIDLD